MAVRIVVTTHDGLGALRRCLEAIRRHTRDVPYRLTVADDASKDGTAAYLRGLAGSGALETRRFRRNAGRAALLNRTAARRPVDWTVLLDDDAVVSPRWLARLLEQARLHPAAAIVGCRIVDAATGFLDSAETRLGDGGVRGERDLGQRAYSRYCDGVSGACLLVRRDVWGRARFWERLRQQYEDLDFCLSARKAGLRILYAGKVAVWHQHLSRNSRHSARNRALMRAKWTSPLFPDSDPIDAAYLATTTAMEAGDWRGGLRQCRRLRLLDRIAAYSWAFEGLCLDHLGEGAGALRAFAAAASDRHLGPGWKRHLQARVLRLEAVVA